MNLSTITMPEALARLHRQFIGSDALFNFSLDNASGFPPHNIEKLSDDHYKLTLALAGYNKDEISVRVENMNLTVQGTKEQTDDNRRFLYRGIAERDFERQFKLMENTFVTGAEFKDGLLSIFIKREVPEPLKPRQIDIT